MNKRFRYLRSAQNEPTNKDKWHLYKEQKRLVKGLLRKAQSDYWKKRLQDADDPQNFCLEDHKRSTKDVTKPRTIKNL